MSQNGDSRCPELEETKLPEWDTVTWPKKEMVKLESYARVAAHHPAV